jgi:luciferase-like monooxygenase
MQKTTKTSASPESIAARKHRTNILEDQPLANTIEQIKEAVLSWPRISVRPHQFAAEEFNFGNAEGGHLHAGGLLDIPFPRAIRNALLEAQLAEQHHFVPNSGWTTFRIRNDSDIDHALWLLRISYLRYALKIDAQPHQLLREETERLSLSPQLVSLLEQFVPREEWEAAT